jgi:hypothetical protein
MLALCVAGCGTSHVATSHTGAALTRSPTAASVVDLGPLASAFAVFRTHAARSIPHDLAADLGPVFVAQFAPDVRLARSLGSPVRIWAVPAVHGVCIFIPHTPVGYATCQSLGSALQGHLLTLFGNASGAITIAGLLPDAALRVVLFTEHGRAYHTARGGMLYLAVAGAQAIEIDHRRAGLPSPSSRSLSG